ncbi:MAG: hypothetical protein JXO44_14925 [Clostridia bacterium]|nr:hypothetical protein [Clostridia bacterium]
MKENTKEYPVYNVGFYLKNEIVKEHKDRYKKHLFAVNDKEGFTYFLLGETKNPHSEAIALSIYDARSDSYKNAVISDGKNYVFSSSSDGENFRVEIVPQDIVDEEGLARFSEDFFQGYAYKISDSTKELKKVYLKNEYQAIKVAALLAMMGAGAFLYYQNVVNKPKPVRIPPKPVAILVSQVEMNEAKRSLNLEVLEYILSETEAIAVLDENETNSWKNTRISLLRMSDFKQIGAETPRYDSKRNVWVYKDESKKRGGVLCTLTSGHQKLYADLDYSKKGKGIFYKEEGRKYEKYFDPNTPHPDPFKEVTTDCIKKAFKLGVVQDRGNGYIHYRFKDEVKQDSTLKVIKSMQDLVKECPAYFSSFNLKDNSKSGEFFIYYNFEKGGKK